MEVRHIKSVEGFDVKMISHPEKRGFYKQTAFRMGTVSEVVSAKD